MQNIFLSMTFILLEITCFAYAIEQNIVWPKVYLLDSKLNNYVVIINSSHYVPISSNILKYLPYLPIWLNWRNVSTSMCSSESIATMKSMVLPTFSKLHSMRDLPAKSFNNSLLYYYNSILYELTPLIIKFEKFPSSGINNAVIPFDNKYLVVYKEHNSYSNNSLNSTVYFNLFNDLKDEKPTMRIMQISNECTEDHRLFQLNKTSILISSTVLVGCDSFPVIGMQILTKYDNEKYSLSPLAVLPIGERRAKSCKNWGAFILNGKLYFVNIVLPLSIVKAPQIPFNLKDVKVPIDTRSRNPKFSIMKGVYVSKLNSIDCHDENSYDLYGLRGGTPAIRVNDQYLSFGHGKIISDIGKITTMNLNQLSSGVVYSLYAYTFKHLDTNSFRLTGKSAWPITHPDLHYFSRKGIIVFPLSIWLVDATSGETLINPKSVIVSSTLIKVSAGINDVDTIVMTFRLDEVLNSLLPLKC